MTPSSANTSGLEMVTKLADHLRPFEHHKVGSLRIDMNEVRNVIAACDFAASSQVRIAELEAKAEAETIRGTELFRIGVGWQDRATAAEARADRLAKALEPFAAKHECDGHATVEDFNMEVQIFVRWAIIKEARAALQQEG